MIQPVMRAALEGGVVDSMVCGVNQAERDALSSLERSSMRER
jgi:hypothetical protein